VVTIHGTWDFKWPVGKVVRVAFQVPSDASTREYFHNARERVVNLAERWNRLVEGKEGYDGPRLEFPDQWNLAPPLGAGAPLGAELRSAFVPADVEAMDYDVLVSLDPLIGPDRRARIQRRDPFDPGGRVRPVRLPHAELGSYARRIDYGEPTAYLGSPFHELSVLEFLGTTAGAHAVVHEFGHVLGLPHTHQNPLYAGAPYRSDLSVIINTAFDLRGNDRLDEAAVREQITEPWEGNAQFSDWLSGPQALAELHSVMAHPALGALISSAGKGDEIGGQLRSALLKPEDLEAKAPFVPTRPTATDLNHLLHMYAPSQGR
jgi:hypothetical protein